MFAEIYTKTDSNLITVENLKKVTAVFNSESTITFDGQYDDFALYGRYTYNFIGESTSCSIASENILYVNFYQES